MTTLSKKGLNWMSVLVMHVKSEGARRNEVTFVVVLSACSHAGFVDKDWHYFLSLSQDYGFQPTMVHYTCMVDILGRAGKRNAAVNFIKRTPFEADAATWEAVLGACRAYGNVKLAEYAAENCLALKPDNPTVYVALSNIHLAAGLSQKASSVRLLMKERGVAKHLGRSWIEVDKKVHHFVVGDTSHPETEEIYAQLTRLTTILKQAGYVPDTSLVMQDLDEQQKEQVLCPHSEKLAILLMDPSRHIQAKRFASSRIFEHVRTPQQSSFLRSRGEKSWPRTHIAFITSRTAYALVGTIGDGKQMLEKCTNQASVWNFRSEAASCKRFAAFWIGCGWILGPHSTLLQTLDLCGYGALGF